MSQEKAQLIAPIGIMTVTGMTATGVITASSFTGNIVGSAKSLVNGTDVTAGVVTGTSFVGNLTGNIQRLADSAPNINVGVTTATSFVGNLTGSVTDLTSQPAITVGLVTATSLSGPITGNVKGNVVGDVTGNITGDVDGDVTGNITGTIAGNVTGNVTGNATGIAGGLGVNYNGGWTGAGTSQVRVGVITATYFHGDGSNLEGVSSGPVSKQSIGITSATTTIDLSNGNMIVATQSANTTVSFANTSNGNVYFIRLKDETTTARTITWPHIINWDGGSAPSLVVNDGGSDKEGQVFLLVTRDMGVTWYGKEIVNYDTLTGYTLWSWGGNQSSGQLGLNDEVDRSSPVQIPGTDYARLPNGHYGYGVGVMKSNKKLWGWGRGDHGILGPNIPTPAQRSSPVQISTSTWANFSVGKELVIATKSNGTMWGWGSNYYGNLGLNENNHPAQKSSPCQLPGTTWPTSLDEFAASSERTMAIKTNGSLWSWGRNSYGDLGNNERDNAYSSPIQIGTDTTWAKVAQGGEGGAIKTNGTLWCWGYNGSGQIGQNNRTYY